MTGRLSSRSIAEAKEARKALNLPPLGATQPGESNLGSQDGRLLEEGKAITRFLNKTMLQRIRDSEDGTSALVGRLVAHELRELTEAFQQHTAECDAKLEQAKADFSRQVRELTQTCQRQVEEFQAASERHIERLLQMIREMPHPIVQIPESAIRINQPAPVVRVPESAIEVKTIIEHAKRKTRKSIEYDPQTGRPSGITEEDL
jgi:hypothetical protein